MARRARGQQPPAMVRAAYPHGVVIKVPRQVGLGQALDVLHRTSQHCGDHKTSGRLIALDEWVRFGFRESEAAYQFRAEADRIVPGLVEPPDEEWQR